MANRLIVRDGEAERGGFVHVVILEQQQKLANPQLSIVSINNGKSISSSGWVDNIIYINPDRQFVENRDLILVLGPNVVDQIPSAHPVRISIKELELEEEALWPHDLAPRADPNLFAGQNQPPPPPPNNSTTSAAGDNSTTSATGTAANDSTAANNNPPPNQPHPWLSELRSWPASALNWLKAHPLLLGLLILAIILIILVFLLFSKHMACFLFDPASDGSFVRDTCISPRILPDPDPNSISSNATNPLVLASAYKQLPRQFWQLGPQSPDGTDAQELINNTSSNSGQVFVDTRVIFYDKFRQEYLADKSNLDEQLYWLKRAAELAHPHALLFLADYYLANNVSAATIDGWDSAELGVQLARMALFFSADATDASYEHYERYLDLRTAVKQRLQQDPLTEAIASDWLH